MIDDEAELIYEAYRDNLEDEPESTSKPDEDESDTTDCGCLMIFFDEQSAEDIKQWASENLPEELLSDDGIEDEPHVTCQYGFDPNVSIEEITDFVNKTISRPIELELGDISKFECPEYDVVKVDVHSEDLHNLSDKIREHFKDRLNITYPEYHPHVTLGYVQKGSLPHIDEVEMFQGKNYKFDEFVYSTAGMEQKYNITNK